MRRCSIFTVALTYLLVAGVAAPSAAAEFDLTDFRTRLGTTASSVTDLFAKGTRTMVAMNGDQPVGPAVTVEVLMAFQDPMKVRMEVESPMGGKTLVVSDGEDVYTFRPDTNEFTKRKVDPQKDPSAPQHLNLPTPEDNKRAMLAQLIPFAVEPLAYVRTVELDAGGETRSCIVLEQDGQSPDGNPFTNTYWVDETMHVVWRQESRAQQTSPQGQVVDLLITTVYDDLRVNERISPDLFKFDPLANAKQVESLTRAQGMSASPWLGKPAPEIALTDLDGVNWTLSSLKGRVTLVNFWATWCGPCKMELPHVEELRQEFERQGLVVLTVSNEPPATIRRYLQAARYEFPVLLDGQAEAGQTYRVYALPTTVIVDRQGNVAEYFVGAQTEDVLRQALAKLGIQ